MKELLSTYSISDILVFIVILALAIRGVVTFYDWTKGRLKSTFDKGHLKEKEQQKVEERIDQLEAAQLSLQSHQKDLTDRLDYLCEKMNLLIESDKDSIKSYLVDKHKEVTRQGYIDSYDYDCFLKRYSHYAAEGGNSYIESLVEEVKDIYRK